MSWRRGIKPDRKRWRKLRLAVLDAQGWTCQRCGGWGHNVDHIKPMDDGGAVYELANLQCLCKKCHIQKTKLENRPPIPERDAWEERLKAYGV